VKFCRLAEQHLEWRPICLCGGIFGWGRWGRGVLRWVAPASGTRQGLLVKLLGGGVEQEGGRLANVPVASEEGVYQMLHSEEREQLLQAGSILHELTVYIGYGCHSTE